MKKTILLALALLLSACAPSQQAVQTAIAQTQAAPRSAAPATEFPVAATAAPVSAKDLDISGTIFGAAAMPEGFAISQIRSAAETTDLQGFDLAPVNQSQEDLTFQGAAGSSASIYLFDAQDQAARAYEYVFARVQGEGQQLELQLGPGAKSFGYAHSLTTSPGTMVVFFRCRALVILKSSAEAAYPGLTDHAIGLDDRLSDFICG